MSDEQGDGPFVKAALFCDQVVEGKDGVLTPVRVIDRFTVSAVGEGAPPDLEAMPAQEFEFTILVMLVAGAARGGTNITLRMTHPSGLDTHATVVWDGSVSFNGGPDQGHNLIVKSHARMQHEGLYWLEVHSGEKLLARSPLRLTYTRSSSVQLGPPA